MSTQIFSRRTVLKGTLAAFFELAFSPLGWAQEIRGDRTEWYRQAMLASYRHGFWPMAHHSRFHQTEATLEIEILSSAPNPDVSVIALNLF